MGSPAKSQTFALDEELWFGEHDDAEAESRAAASLAAVGARIVGAKPFPVAARRLDELTRNPSTRIEQVVNVLESDPALSARLLRLVNSAGYGLKVRVTSVRHAAVLVGTRRLNQVATTAAILDLFDGNSTHGVELLEHAAVVGSLCRYLAVHQGLPHDELFTCGFLHDIGKLMLLDAERERYAELLQEFGHAPDQIHLAERKLFGFDHAVLGAHVLTAWNIPEPVPRVIAWHHAPARAMQDTVVSAMVQTLRLADLLAYVLALPDTEQAINLAAASEAANYLEVSDVQLAAMWGDLVALRDRSRARSHGEPELDVMVPSRVEVPSLRAKSSTGAPQSGARTGRPLHEVPSHFPCSVCAKPSFGNVCAACGGHVCPSHQVGADEWCTVCAREFTRFKKKAELSAWMRAGVGVLVGGSLSVALYSASRAPDAGVETLILAPILVLALWAVLLPVAYRLWQKLAFLERRRSTSRFDSMSVARPRSVPIQAAAQAAPAPEVAPAPLLLSSSPVSEVDVARGQDDAPLSMAPLSTAPLSVPPLLSANPSASLPAPRRESMVELKAAQPDSVAPPPMLSPPEVVAPQASVLPSVLPDADFLSVRPTSVSVALSAHFGKNNTNRPQTALSQQPAEPSLRPLQLVPERSPLVSERPQLGLSESVLDALPVAAPAPVIREVEPSLAPPSVAPPAASVVPAAPSVAPVVAQAPSLSPSISMGPPTVLSFAPEASLPPEAPPPSLRPEVLQQQRVSLPAPDISIGPPAVLSFIPPVSEPPAAPDALIAEDGPDSGPQPLSRPPVARVVNSPLVSSSACTRQPLQACVGRTEPKISYRPAAAMDTPGSRESA
ncbi:MAG: HDOD domain-containing protein [Polyangiaceae bacterium]